MRRPTDAKHDIGGVALAVTLTVLIGAVAAQQPPPQEASETPPKPLVPLAAVTLANEPDAYYGEFVSLAGAVDRILSPTAFSVDQDRTASTGKDVLVLAPALRSPVEANVYVTIIGEVVRFDPTEIASKLEGYTLDLDADTAATYAGRPVVLATSVITPALVDLTKRYAPPMTEEEEAFQALMRKIAPAFGAVRKAVEASNADLIKENAPALKEAFVETEAFWRSKDRSDARRWARDARRHAEDIEKAAAEAKWDEVKEKAGELGKFCQTCHAAYRERFDDGAYRIKLSRGESGGDASF